MQFWVWGGVSSGVRDLASIMFIQNCSVRGRMYFNIITVLKKNCQIIGPQRSPEYTVNI